MDNDESGGVYDDEDKVKKIDNKHDLREARARRKNENSRKRVRNFLQ